MENEKRDAQEDRGAIGALRHYPIEPCLGETAQRILDHWIDRYEEEKSRAEAAEKRDEELDARMNKARNEIKSALGLVPAEKGAAYLRAALKALEVDDGK